MIPVLKSGGDLSRVLCRSQLNLDETADAVKKIVYDVRERGDAALFEYTQKFDGIVLTSETLEVTQSEKDAAYKAVDKKTLNAMRNAKKNIIDYHLRQMRSDNIESKNGKTTGWLIRPVNRAGIYVPGGKAAYPSSVLMCALPAYVAGVKEIIMTTPGGKYLNPLTIVAACECGIKRIFKAGGAQSIAALAFGTESIPKVDVITGPGNIYVTLAKKEVFGNVAIDMIAGPSEILIIADESAKADFVAADMLSQAEHDELAMSVLITTSEDLAQKVNEQISLQLEKLEKKTIAAKSLQNFGAIIIAKDLSDAVDLSNRIAPEHLELCVKEPDKLLDKIENAGAVFLGNFSPEPLGDYYAGPNHVLPTSSTAKHFSVLSVDNYLKKISVIKYDEPALKNAAADIILLAQNEGLTAHANTIKVRFKKTKT